VNVPGATEHAPIASVAPLVTVDRLASTALRDALQPWLTRLPMLAELHGPIIVACSGGADSLALLALASAAGLAPTAVHIDHGLRPESASEGPLVAAAAARVGAGFVTRRVEVLEGAGLEAAARDARYAALIAYGASSGATATAVGHTADDQAETVLLNVLRGAGLDGLAGMPARRDLIVRPMLPLRRADTVEICARLGLDPIDDPMNADLRFRRVFIRRTLLPELIAAADRDIVPVLARQAELAAEDRAVLDAAAKALLAAAIADDPTRLHAAAFRDAPRALTRRALRRWLGDPPVPAAEVERLLAVLDGSRVAVQLAGGRTVRRVAGQLLVEPTGTNRSDELRPLLPCRLAVPGRVEVGGTVIDCRVERSAPVGWPDGAGTCVLDADVVGAQVTVRAAYDGERMPALGAVGRKAIAVVLAERGVAPAARPQVPIVASASTDEALWVVGYRVAATARVTERTRRFLWLTVESAPQGVASIP
jgi:tRNA(Ile)-lysidine synthase